jgi:threonine aldolase
MIDLGSDTVSARTLAMPRAAANAPVCVDFDGDDPSLLALEHRTPELLSKNDAVVSGAVINQVREAA